MKACQTVFRIVVLIVYLTLEGIDVQVTYGEVNNIHDINATLAVFECNKRAIVRCYGPKNSFINWQINSSVSIGTSLSAQCFAGFECDVFNNFSDRYSFKYNSSTGISDLTILPVSLQDNGMEYKCSDRPEPPLKAAVRNFLGDHSYTLQNGTSVDRSNILFNLTIDCTAEYVNITWYSRAKNGTDYRIHKATLYTESECLAGSCIEPGKSKIISSLLELVIVTDKKQRRKREVGDGRVFGCSITSDSWNFSIPIQGTYTLKVLQSTKAVPGSGLSDSAIIAMCVAIPGSVIAVVIVVFFVVCCIRHRRMKATDAPGTPVGFELVRDSVTEVSAAFRCLPIPYQPGKQEIVLFCQQANNGTHTADNSQIIDDTGARVVTLWINNLRMGCVYDCSVFARNKNIRSENSGKIRIRTLGLPDAPTDFSVVRVKQDSIHLSWIPGHYRMNQQSFVLELMNTKNGDITLEPIKMDNVIPLMHAVEGLPEGTTFIINLRAKNDVGDSDNVGPLKVTTIGNPEPPSELKEVGVTSSSISISWRPGTYRRQTQFFVIEYGRKKKKFENIKWKPKKKVDDGQTVMNFTLYKLKSGTAYVVVIFARNDKGESARTLPLSVSTKEENVVHKH